MDERPEQLERVIEDRRNRLTEDLGELKRKAQDAVDWRVQFEERPGTMMGLAFGAGFLLSAIVGGPRRSTRTRRAKAESDYGYVPQSERSESSVTRSPGYRGQGSFAWDNVKEALVGLAIAKAENFLEDILPGITDEYRKAELRNSSTDPGSSRIH